MADENTEITKTRPASIERLQNPEGDVVVLARNPDEMAKAQQGLIDWAERKVKFEAQELAEAEENLAVAKKMKHRTAGWTNNVRVGKNRVKYYEKIVEALQEGYCIVPDFPIQVIATRTNKKAPKKTKRGWGYGSVEHIKHEQLPKGVGDYVDPTPEWYPNSRTRQLPDGRSTEDNFVVTTGRHNPVDFPFKMVKPQIMSDFSRAMALKLFDEIGVLPEVHRKTPDPMVIGRIKSRGKGSAEMSLSFIITWWVDTRTLG